MRLRDHTVGSHTLPPRGRRSSVQLRVGGGGLNLTLQGAQTNIGANDDVTSPSQAHTWAQSSAACLGMVSGLHLVLITR